MARLGTDICVVVMADVRAPNVESSNEASHTSLRQLLGITCVANADGLAGHIAGHQLETLENRSSPASEGVDLSANLLHRVAIRRYDHLDARELLNHRCVG